MGKFWSKNFYLLPTLGFIAFTAPFIKYPSSVKITDANPLYINYERLSGLDMVWDSIEVLFSPPALPQQDGGMIPGVIALVIAIILLLQFTGIILQKKSLIFYTSILLFAAFLVNLMLLAKDGFVTLLWAYFIYLLLQVAIMLLVPLTSKKENDTQPGN